MSPPSLQYRYSYGIGAEHKYSYIGVSVGKQSVWFGEGCHARFWPGSEGRALHPGYLAQEKGGVGCCTGTGTVPVEPCTVAIFVFSGNVRVIDCFNQILSYPGFFNALKWKDCRSLKGRLKLKTVIPIRGSEHRALERYSAHFFWAVDLFSFLCFVLTYTVYSNNSFEVYRKH